MRGHPGAVHAEVCDVGVFIVLCSMQTRRSMAWSSNYVTGISVCGTRSDKTGNSTLFLLEQYKLEHQTARASGIRTTYFYSTPPDCVRVSNICVCCVKR